jgi:hypothetical protein
LRTVKPSTVLASTLVIEPASRPTCALASELASATVLVTTPTSEPVAVFATTSVDQT